MNIHLCSSLLIGLLFSHAAHAFIIISWIVDTSPIKLPVSSPFKRTSFMYNRSCLMQQLYIISEYEIKQVLCLRHCYVIISIQKAVIPQIDITLRKPYVKHGGGSTMFVLWCVVCIRVPSIFPGKILTQKIPWGLGSLSCQEEKAEHEYGCEWVQSSPVSVLNGKRELRCVLCGRRGRGPVDMFLPAPLSGQRPHAGVSGGHDLSAALHV